jgi:hypothetical protein
MSGVQDYLDLQARAANAGLVARLESRIRELEAALRGIYPAAREILWCSLVLIFTHRSHASAVNSSSLSLALLIPFFRRNASSLRPFWITVFIGLVLWFLLEALLA